MKVSDKKDKAELETMKKKFTTMLKSVLYSCICMNNIPEDIMNYIELVCSDSVCEQIAKDFKIDVDELSDIISRMNDAEIMQINMLIYQLKCLLDDNKLKPIQRVSNAISKLGQLDKNEVVTGSDLVNKMLDKLGDMDMSGKSILEVNSKYGEFLIQIYERYGKEVANNVKVVASSDMTKNFIRKVLNILELDEQNLIELEDYNGNGIYDIKDFVEAPNEKILKYNKGMKFDCIVSNAPYDRGLHEKFEAKYFELCKGEIVWVAPNSWLNGKSKNKAICDSANKCYFNVESINGNSYFDAAIGSDLSIVFADMTKDSRIIIDGKIYNSIYDYTSYSNDNLLVYFKNKIEYLYKNDNFENYLKAVDGAKHWQLHRELNPQDSWWCIKVPAIRGNVSSNSGYMSDFYTLISNNKKELDEFIFGQYKDLSKKKRRKEIKHYNIILHLIMNRMQRDY